MNRWLNKISIRQIILLGFVLRLIAVIFSKGYAFSDDHFEVVELAQKWRDGVSLLEKGLDISFVSLVYPGFHYILFDALNVLGIKNPQDMMLVTRLLHALVSLLTIYYSYLLTIRLTGNKNTGKLVAFSMAIFWLFPFMSVRNLREFVCIPFLLIGSYHAANPKLNYRSIILAGLFFAIAVCLRLQNVFIPF